MLNETRLESVHRQLWDYRLLTMQFCPTEIGEKIKCYPCCDTPQGGPGCREGPHVFKEDDFLSLHGRVPFIETPKDSKPTRAQAVVAMDCEMVRVLVNI